MSEAAYERGAVTQKKVIQIGSRMKNGSMRWNYSIPSANGKFAFQPKPSEPSQGESWTSRRFNAVLLFEPQNIQPNSRYLSKNSNHIRDGPEASSWFPWLSRGTKGRMVLPSQVTTTPFDRDIPATNVDEANRRPRIEAMAAVAKE